MTEARRALRPIRRVPEVLQSSLTDCGPAALQAVLEGFGIHESYDALRERCQTDVDGTSIDALAALARELGLGCQQVLVPFDHLLLPEARCLPAIVVTRGAGGQLHFVVVWRRLGPLCLVMDPSSGRRWQRARHLLAELPVLPVPISRAHFRRWAGGEEASRIWQARARALGVSARGGRELVEGAAADASHAGYARLDAALRMASTLVASGASRRGREVERLLHHALAGASGFGIPERFHWVRAAPTAPDQLITHGAVLLRFTGRSEAKAPRPKSPRRAAKTAPEVKLGPESVLEAAPAPSTALPDAVLARLAAPKLRPLWVLWSLATARAGARLGWLLFALVLGAALVPAEALVLRTVFDLQARLTLGYQQLAWLLGILSLSAGGLWLEHWSSSVLARLGRELETRVRAALLERLPRLGDRYARSRPSSDLANRAHCLHQLRSLPALWAQMARAACSVAALGAVLLWLYPEAWRASAALAGTALLIPLCGRRALAEQSLRLHTQAAALDRFYLDTLLGVVPIRVHGAGPAIQVAHERLLSEWGSTARGLRHRQTWVQALQIAATTGAAVLLIVGYLRESPEAARALVLAYLALRLPVSANELLSADFALHGLGSVALRTLAPLAVPLDGVQEASAQLAPAPPEAADAARRARAPSFAATRQSSGASLALESVNVVAGGHALLRDVTLQVAPAEHVGIVGASGAGKSSLLGVLLGWLQPAAGRVWVDGRLLDAGHSRALRDQIAWLDPAIQLWDQSLLDNLTYGNDGDPAELIRALPLALSRADLLEVLERSPDGLQSNVGEGGASLSGGQGQRVRLGRALLRYRPRLVLLDEPFRGLPREQRRALLENARRHWHASTLLFASHDVEDTSDLDRVVVIDAGRIVEQGEPSTLLADPGSRYAELCRRARALRAELWHAGFWRKLQVLGGKLGPSLPARRSAGVEP